MLDYEHIKDLKDKGIEYPADFGKFDSDSITANFNSICSGDIALSGHSQMLIKNQESI